MRNTRPPVFSIGLFLIGAALILVQQLPYYKENHYEEFRTYIYVVFGLLSVVSFLKVFVKGKRAPLLNIYTMFIAAIGLELVALYLIGREVKFGELLEIVVPFGLVLSSYALPLEKRTLERVSKTYAIAILAVSLIQVFYYAGGFLLYEQYIVSDKNIIGSFVAAAAAIAYYYALIYVDAGRNLSSIVWIVVFALLTAVLVTIRSRAALLAVLAVILIMTFKSRRVLRKLVVAVSFIAIVSIMFSGLLQMALNSVRESVVLGYEYTDVDSLSGGRFGVYSEAVEIIRLNPLFGELSLKEQSPRIPHNYLLNKVKKYGFLGGALFILLYFYLAVFIFVNIKSMRGISLWGLPIFLLAIPFLISLLEYQHPYGPGTSQAIVYFFLGQFVLVGFQAPARKAVQSGPGVAGRSAPGGELRRHGGPWINRGRKVR